MHTLSQHLRGNLVAYLALFVALGGSSYAAFSGSEKAATLASGKTLRGTWGYADTITNNVPIDVVSFPTPLAQAPREHVIQENGTSTDKCPGSVNHPKALPGHFCVYVGRDDGDLGVFAANSDAVGGGKYGFPIAPETGGPDDNIEQEGTWAVTAR